MASTAADRGKGAAAAPVATKGAKPQSRLVGKLRTLVTLRVETEKDEGDLKTHEVLRDENANLSKQLNSKAKQLADLESIIAGLRAERKTLLSTAKRRTPW
jgi:hypothetical protein